MKNSGFILAGIGALLLVTGKKKGSKASAPESGGGGDSGGGGGGKGSKTGRISTKKKEDIGKPWDTCDPPPGSRLGTYAAYGKDGKCMVFWDVGTPKVVRTYIDQHVAQMSKAQKDAICDDSHESGYAPAAVVLAEKIIKEMYPQLELVKFPPTEKMQDYPRLVWSLVYREILHHHCGYVAET